MIIITLTGTKRKMLFLLKIALIILLIAVLVPSFYNIMVEANALEYFSGNSEEEYPGEPMRVNAGLEQSWVVETGYWQDIFDMISDQ